MKVINFFGAPSSGKSTKACELFVYMKKLGINCELVTEYAKDMVYEDRSNVLADQLYILAKQNRRLKRLENKVDYAISDSPLLLGIIYDSTKNDELRKLIYNIYYSYNNINFFLKLMNYKPHGRIHSEEECKILERRIYNMSSWHNSISITQDTEITEIFKYI